MPNIINNPTSLVFVVGGQHQAFEFGSTEADTNATIIYQMLAQTGWTKAAVAALFGNIQNESSFNPNRHESGGSGFGLVQWTPPSNLTDILDVLYPEGYDRSDGVKQVNALYAEYQQTNSAQGNPDAADRGVHRQWYNSNGSRYGFDLPKTDWYDWAHADNISVRDLTLLFMVSYERPAYDAETNHWPRRVESAQQWFDWLGGVTPTPGGAGNFSPSTSSGNTGKGVLKVTSKEIIKAIQAILKANGYYNGQLDGIMGPKTRAGLSRAGVK